MPDFKIAKCVKNEKISSTYHDLVFETAEPFEFEPGQYITCKVSEDRLNSYSIAGKLSENQFGFLVDVKPGGPGSQFFANLGSGGEMPFLGPFGKFVLNLDDGASELVFMGTGSGIAPLKAMIEAAIAQGTDKKMALYFGLRHNEDVFWGDYFSSLASAHENLKFMMCLSKPNEQWGGACGHITELVKNDYPDLSHAAGYLCGGMKMIEEAKQVLAGLNMPAERIYHEKFY